MGAGMYGQGEPFGQAAVGSGGGGFDLGDILGYGKKGLDLVSGWFGGGSSSPINTGFNPTEFGLPDVPWA
jgi:hypothetical protein